MLSKGQEFFECRIPDTSSSYSFVYFMGFILKSLYIQYKFFLSRFSGREEPRKLYIVYIFEKFLFTQIVNSTTQHCIRLNVQEHITVQSLKYNLEEKLNRSFSNKRVEIKEISFDSFVSKDDQIVGLVSSVNLVLFLVR